MVGTQARPRSYLLGVLRAGSARLEQASVAGSASSKPGWWGPSPGTWVQQLGWGPRLAVSNELPGDVDQPACGAQ